METKIVNILKVMLDTDKYLAFVIKKEILFWEKGKPKLLHKIIFQGYVMVQTICNAEDVIRDMRPIISIARNNIYKILNYGSDNKDIMIRKSEQVMWESLIDSDFFIRASFGIIDKGNLKVTSGPLVGKEAEIKKLNKYKRKAIVDVEFAGEFIEISLVLDLIDKSKKE